MIIDSTYIEITNICNLNCRDCYNSSGLNKERVDIPVEVIKNYIDEVLKINERSDSNFSFSGGEPLLHLKWDEIAKMTQEYCNRINPPKGEKPKEGQKTISFSLVSNGTTYNERIYKLLAENRAYNIQYSLDGCDEETNAKTRGSGYFQKVIDTVKNNKFVHKPTLKMVISQYNKHQIEEYYRFVVELGCMPNFAFINHMGNAVEDWEQKTILPKEKVRIVQLIESLDKEYDLKTNPPYMTLGCPLPDKTQGRSLLIKPTGQIHPCQMFYSELSEIGSIYNFDVEEVENRLDDFAKLIEERNKIDFGCSKCFCASQCKKGCPGLAVEAYNGLNFADSGCSFRKTYFAKIVADSTNNTKQETVCNV